ncbi:TetR family transcriptional regulator [Phytomonospora sp. NPDC050363]|uniref:TetR family transcriptional regulator n=1 Tax=Phytomonospora sp. NPDC050363 TaxID=3155642 RepID=UPI0033C7593D
MTRTDLPLRERKKLRNRRLLVDTAIELFGEHGFDEVTVEDLVGRVELSPRTFFRLFDSKEDVVLEPVQRLWGTFTATIGSCELRGPLVATLERVLVGAIESMDDDWAGQFLAGRRIAERTPALAARELRFCADTTVAIGALLAGRTGLDATDLRLRLALEVMLAVWHTANQDWAVAAGPADPEWLVGLVRDGFAALPEALGLTVG